MNITYIIGNGFDLNLGFPTAYSHFYRYYCNVPSKSKMVQLLKDNIEQYKDKDWRDLELGLGKFTSKVSTPDDFKEAYIDLNSHMAKYMSAVDRLIQTKISVDLKEKIIRDMLFPESELSFDLTSDFGLFREKISRKYVGDGTVINIISFNYTHTFEQLKLKNGENLNKDKTSTFHFDGINHVHRCVGDKGLWLGVNDISQISNESFRESDLVKLLLIKPYDIRSSGTGLIGVEERIIGNSDLICIFGSSMGETDRMWWEMIGKHMLRSECRLIHYSIDHNGFEMDHLLLFRQNTIRSEIVSKMIGNSKTVSPLNDSSKITIQINSNLFKDKDYSSELEQNYETIMSWLTPHKI